MAQEQVNHPTHYNSNPAGVECITVIRHYVCDIANALKYLWRAGLKTEMGKEDVEKEIEDLRKALWYINDYWDNAVTSGSELAGDYEFERIFRRQIGLHPLFVFRGFHDDIATAVAYLLPVGFVHRGEVIHVRIWRECLEEAIKAINRRIEILKAKTNHE